MSSCRVIHVLALIGATVLVAGGAVMVPIAANAATTNLTLDCATTPSGSQKMYVAPGNTYTFDLTGYGTVQDRPTNTDIATLNPAGDSYAVASGQDLVFKGATTGPAPCASSFRVRVYDAAPETVPAGNLLFTKNITIPLNPPELTVTETQDFDHYFGGQPTCAVSTYVHGQHVYGTLNVTVVTAGTYTFRGIASDPAGRYLPLQPFDPIGDPFLAVYHNFDPSQPDVGVVGCNDDLNDLGALHQAELLPGGRIMEGHQPYFVASLNPGSYTLVLLTYDDLSTADFAAGNDQYDGRSFVVGPKSTQFELWGPTGGLALPDEPISGTPASGTGTKTGGGLAFTGANTDASPVGFALLLLGLAGMYFGRRKNRSHPAS